MYNFNFLEDEILIEVFDKVLIRQNNNEKITTIALTNKRLLFLDYITNDGLDTLRIINKLNLVRTKEVYYSIALDEIDKVYNDEYFIIKLKDNTKVEFNELKLFKLLGGK